MNLPFLANAGGFPFEYAQSAAHFLESPHGPAGIVSPACLRVYSIPKDILAKDVLNILAQDTRNLEAIMTSSRAALVAPPVPGCDRENYYRLFLLGDIRATLHLDALDSHMAQYCPDDYTPWMEKGTIEGLEGYNKLRDMYEHYYSTRAPQPSSGPSIPAVSQPTVTSTATAPLPAAWDIPPPAPTAMSIAMEHDFPPLPGTVITRDTSASTSTGELARVDQGAQLQFYVQSILAQEIEKV